MSIFLLTRPAGEVRAQGSTAGYADVATATAALRGGDVPIVVGALPFDPGAKAALVAPAEFEFRTRRATLLQPLPRLTLREQIPAPAEHRTRVARLIDAIRTGPLRKVVAARSEVFVADSPIDPDLLAAHLISRHPATNGFVVDLHDGTLVGASPEVLVSRRGRRVTLAPLAGTVPRAADETGARLRASAKNLEEHAYVVDWIRAQLTPLCTELHIPDSPELVATPEVWHLMTPITGLLAESAPSALELAALLHPTPAVGGTPHDLALAAIAASEEDRGFYGGAVGWCDRAGDGDWVVAIRCAELDAERRTLRAFAGGGIVATSDPQDELDETTAKLRTILAPFTVDPDSPASVFGSIRTSDGSTD